MLYSLQPHKEGSCSDIAVFFPAEIGDDHRSCSTFSNKSTMFVFISAPCLFILPGLFFRCTSAALCLERTFEKRAVSSYSILECCLFVNYVVRSLNCVLRVFLLKVHAHGVMCQLLHVVRLAVCVCVWGSYMKSKSINTNQ